MSEPFVVLLGACFVFGLARWRAAAIAAIVLAVGEGALRKWAFPDAQQYVYFLKDALLFGAYVGHLGGRLVRHQRLIPAHPANPALGFFAVLVALEAVNPGLPSPLVGLFGIRAYLMYVPLMYLVPALFPDTVALRRFWVWYLLLALVSLAIGPIQYNSAFDSELNRYSWSDEPNAWPITFGTLDDPIRVTGTFSFISGYTTYLLVILAVGSSVTLFARRVRTRWALFGYLTLAALNLLMTGSRGPFLVLAGALPLLFMIAAQVRGVRAARAALAAIILIPLVATFLPAVFSEGVGSVFMARVRRGDSVVDRAIEPLRSFLDASEVAGAFGYGAGSTHQAVAFLEPDFRGITPPAEDEWQRIVLELGPLGLALTLMIRILVAVRLWRALRSTDDTGRPFIAAALVFVLAHVPGSLVFNHTAALFYWFMAGFALIAPRAGASREVVPAPIVGATRAPAER